MNWGDIGSLVQQYTGAGTATAPSETVHEDYAKVASAAPQSVVANGLSEAFRSDQTPAFGSMIASLFSHSNGDQKSGMLNQLLAAAGGSPVSTDQAQNMSPDQVQQIAETAKQKDPSIIDTASSFYAQHPTLVKALGGAAAMIAIRSMAGSMNR